MANWTSRTDNDGEDLEPLFKNDICLVSVCDVLQEMTFARNLRTIYTRVTYGSVAQVFIMCFFPHSITFFLKALLTINTIFIKPLPSSLIVYSS